MPRRKIPGMALRNVRVNLESYNWIKEFFENSPSGISTTEACCEVLRHFGIYCKAQMDAGVEASRKDLEAIPDIVLGLMTQDKSK